MPKACACAGTIRSSGATHSRKGCKDVSAQANVLLADIDPGFSGPESFSLSSGPEITMAETVEFFRLISRPDFKVEMLTQRHQEISSGLARRMA